MPVKAMSKEFNGITQPDLAVLVIYAIFYVEWCNVVTLEVVHTARLSERTPPEAFVHV